MKYENGLNHVKQETLYAVMSTVHYFDIFRHPLQQNELLKLIHHHIITPDELSNALIYLTKKEILFEHEGYYLPHTRFENIARRKEGQTLSEKFWEKALRQSRLISRFPFVRGVLISGSLSKGYMDEHSDIDYLIITNPGRLWIARTLLVLYKKIFLLNSHKFFCVNYFLDLNNLVLTDRNLFTATELVFAKPSFNFRIYNELVIANPWTKDYYPSYQANDMNDIIDNPEFSKFQNFLEKLLNNKAGDFLDRTCMKISENFWKKKFNNMTPDQFQRDMKSSKGVSKHHPNGFRDKILDEHRTRMNAFTNQMRYKPGKSEKSMQPV
jgi:hypothetical protein